MGSLFERLLGSGESDEQVDLRARQERADEHLRARIDEDAYGIDECGVTGVAVVNEGPDEQPIVVPIARFSLGEDVESPDTETVWRLVGDALPILHDAFDDVFVRHFDVQFTFDGDGLFEAQECRRVAITPEIAERYATDAGFTGTDLKETMFDRHDIDDDVAPVAWGECKDYSNRQNAAVVTGGAMVAASSASAASCAGAGAAGGGGGAC